MPTQPAPNVLLAGAIGIALSTAAFAASAASTEQVAIEEVVVTAQMRAQDVE